jgi:hypothetical protein
MRKVKVALAVGLALLAAVVAVTLTRSPPRVLRVGVPTGDAGDAGLAGGPGRVAVCQPDETLPAGTSGIRLATWAFYGAKIHVRVYSGSRVLTEGSRGPDWTSDSVTVPVKPLQRSVSGVELCFGIGPTTQPVTLLGIHTTTGQAASARGRSEPTLAAATSTNAVLKGRVGVEYLGAGHGSWWSRVSSVAKRMGLGRAYSGAWIALLVAALMAAAGVLAIGLTLRELP